MASHLMPEGMPPDPNPNLRLVDSVKVCPIDDAGNPIGPWRDLGPAIIDFHLSEEADV